MKKTLSFEKDLTFQTMIGEITTISFEEDLKFVDKSDIAGNFYVSGKYKMLDASTILEDFSYSIPIEIATIESYDLDTTKISIENFTYEIVDDDVLRCKIDILIEGREEVIIEEDIKDKKIEEEESNKELEEYALERLEENNKEKEEIKEDKSNEDRECDSEEIDKILEELPIKKEIKETKQIKAVEKDSISNNKTKEVIIDNKKDEKSDTIQNENIIKKDEKSKIEVNSLFANLGEEGETFTTYSVYIMREGDTLEKVMNQYNVNKETLEVYNDLSTIELNSKVIIPTNNNE